MRPLSTALLALALGACNNSVASTADAQRSYLGLDPSIDRAIGLGFDGFDSASSANIAPQTASGTASGSMTITGQVDQGSSANKGMRLFDALTGYSDDGKITYDTDANALPALDMMLKGIPTGTLTGTLAGNFAMTGAEHGNIALDLSFAGDLEAGTGSSVERKPGTTHITGTATSSFGVYQVDITR